MSEGINMDDLKRMLNEKKRMGDTLERMEYRTPPGKSTVRREVKTPDGETIYIEDRQITVNPYSAQQEHTIVQISQRCESCAMPITGEMLALDLIKPEHLILDAHTHRVCHTDALDIQQTTTQEESGLHT